MSIYWVYLLLSGVFGIGMAVSARFVHGYDSIVPTLVFFNFLLISWLLLERAAIGVPWGTAFAVWAGVAAVGTVIVELIFFGAVASVGQHLSFTVMALGLVGYILTSIN